jgi:hypothetical protein
MGSCPGVRRDGRVSARSLQPGSDTHDRPNVGRYNESRDPGADDGRHGRHDDCSHDRGDDGSRDDGTDHGRYDGADDGRYH